MIGVAAAEKLDTSFHSPDDLARHTRVPILVRIPQMSTESALDRTRARRRSSLLALGLLAGVFLTVNASRIMAQDNEGVVSLLAPRGRP